MCAMVDKFQMSRKTNVFYAKRLLVDSIYRSARLEGINVTFPQVAAILENCSVSKLGDKLRVEDVINIRNLRDAWELILDSNVLEYESDLSLICQINKIVGQSTVLFNGQLRPLPVGITGTSWAPPIPEEEKVKQELQQIYSIPCDTKRAIRLMLYLMRSQLFMDGNKRTATMAANHMLIQNNRGILTIKPDDLEEFRNQLVSFYETGDYDKISQFVYDRCIDGTNEWDKYLKSHPEEDQSDDFRTNEFGK